MFAPPLYSASMTSTTGYTICSCICVDTRPEDSTVHYPLMGQASPDERRLHYWRMALTLMATSARCNPGHRHVIFTNDRKPAVVGQVDVKQRLQELGVELIDLPYEHFKLPAGLSQKFTNTFYRFEIFGQLAQWPEPAMLLDTDIIFSRPSPELAQAMTSEDALMYDIYQREKTPHSREAHGISMHDMGTIFHQVDKDFTIKAPVWYGGEIMAGTPAYFGRMFTYLSRQIHGLIALWEAGQPLPAYPNGKQIFNSDEFLLSMAVNAVSSPAKANQFLKRIYALPYLNNLKTGDEYLPMWHLPSEKHTGLALLYEEVADKNSGFWQTPVDQLGPYLGGMVGIPRRTRRLPSEAPIKDMVRNIRGKLGIIVRRWQHKLR